MADRAATAMPTPPASRVRRQTSRRWTRRINRPSWGHRSIKVSQFTRSYRLDLQERNNCSGESGQLVRLTSGLSAQVLDHLSDLEQVGIDFQGSLIAAHCLGEILHLGVAVSHAGPSAKVAGHQLGGHLAIAFGPFVILDQVIGYGALVIRFSEAGGQLDGPIEVCDCRFKVAIVQASSALCQLGISRLGSTSKPDGPEGMLSHLVGHHVWIAESLGNGRNTASPTYKRQREGGHLSRIFVCAPQEVSDLVWSPVGLQVRQQPLQVISCQERFDRRYEKSRIN